MTKEELKQEFAKDREFASNLHTCLQAMFEGLEFDNGNLTLEFGTTNTGRTKTVTLSNRGKDLIELQLDATKTLFFFYHNKPEKLTEEDQLIRWSLAYFANIPYKYLTIGYAYTIPEPYNLDHWKQCKTDALELFLDPDKGPHRFITVAPGMYEHFYREHTEVGGWKLHCYRNEYGVEFIRYAKANESGQVDPVELPGIKP